MKFVGDVFMLTGISKSVPDIIVMTGTPLYLVESQLPFFWAGMRLQKSDFPINSIYIQKGYSKKKGTHRICFA